MDTKMASKSKKLLRDTLFLVELDDRRIVTGFYVKKQRYDMKIEMGPNF